MKKQADVYQSKHEQHNGACRKKESGNGVEYMKYLSYSAMHKIDYNLRSKEMQGSKMNTLLHNTVIQNGASGGGVQRKHEKLYLCCVS